MKRRWVLAGLVVLLVLEIGVRVARNGSDPEGAGVSFRFDYHHADSRLLRWAMAKAGGFDDAGVWMSINAQGRRGTVDHVIQRPADVALRVAVVGTGNAFGFRVPDGATWPEQLQLQLRAAGAAAGGAEAQVEVLNFAYPGSTVVHLERTVVDQVAPYRPDVVVIAYGGYNEALLSQVDEARYVDPDAGLRNLLRGSAALRELESVYWDAVRDGPRRARVPVAEFEARLARAVGAFEAMGARVLLVQEVVVYPDVPGWWTLTDMDAYHAAVERVSEARGVPVVDPAEVLPPEGPARYAAFASGLVYGPDACALIGEQVARALAAR